MECCHRIIPFQFAQQAMTCLPQFHVIKSPVALQFQHISIIYLGDIREIIIGEIILHFIAIYLKPLGIEQIEIGGTSRKQKQRASAKRQAKSTLRRHRTHRQFAMCTTRRKTIFCPKPSRGQHIHATPKPIGKRSGSRRFQQTHFVEMSGIEDGEETQQMCRIINRYTAEGNKIMGIIASLDMQTGIILRIGLYSRQELGIMHRICIAQNMRHIIHELHVDDAGTLYLPQLRAKALAPNLHILKSIMIERVGQFSRHALEYAECYINKYAENSFHYQIIP